MEHLMRVRGLLLSMIACGLVLATSGRCTALQAGFHGAPDSGSSPEAQAMSPAHWGNDTPVWPTPHPDQGPGCEVGQVPGAEPRAIPVGAESRSRFSPPPGVTGQPATRGGTPNPSTGDLRLYVPRPRGALPVLPQWPFRPNGSALDQTTGAGSSRFVTGTGQTVVQPERYPLFPASGPSGIPARPSNGVQEPVAGQSPGGDPALQPPPGVIFFPLPQEGGVVPVEPAPAMDAGQLLPPQDGSGAEPGANPPLAGNNPLECADWERGFRQSSLTIRPQVWDDGTEYDFENKKKHYPPMSEILATGRYFGMAEWQALKPYHIGNHAIAVQSGISSSAISHDFDFEAAHRLRLGFESKYGPGFELQYAQYDHLSDTAGFTSDGLATGTSEVEFGAGGVTSLGASGAGEQLTSRHDLEIHSLTAMFFKEVKLPISRVNGTFGLRYVSVAQQMLSQRMDGGGNLTGSLLNLQDLRALGPTLGLEYYRPVGHTPLELIGSFGGALLFGNRDQYVSNAGVLDYRSVGDNEFLVQGDFYGGLQYVRNWAEKRSWYARFGVQHQVWLGGGTGTDPGGDFGLRGVSFGMGWNR